MAEIHKSQKAEADLIEIWLYGNANWGPAQADLYLDQLQAGLDRMVEFPEIGSDCSTLRAGYRMLAIARHLVFYRIEDDIIHVMRVLHHSMKVEEHL